MIKPIPYYKTIPFHKEGKKNNLIFHENTNYIGYYIKKELVAIAGYDVLENKAILRSSFVDHNYRSQGIYNELVSWRIDFLKSKNINTKTMPRLNSVNAVHNDSVISILFILFTLSL